MPWIVGLFLNVAIGLAGAVTASPILPMSDSSSCAQA
jgi:uncharacterized membrane protein YeaQ/YmgE (transglycosylase-associated protein family)